ncbi:hypothetical protein GPECTOR_28g857 [Gonium pectorale]|uniref:Cytosol aminopeptidase domain-containing protein n=1 Tax=Gonium pectorale TaxID=33097 RepID=A0A150GF18_GONPE|nr:hypothetical protein GPECTOR_28g857 [Gonium pectorale]|eukprot:KXZ48447.1 hypothetical protein GPECTOR_28g857 [Gonium pectorale]
MASSATEPSIAGLEYWFSRRCRYDGLLVEAPGSGGEEAVPVQPVAQADLASLLASLEPPHASWASTTRFKAAAGELCLLPSPQGGMARVLLGLGSPPPAPSEPEPWPYAVLAKLPPTVYRLLPPHAAAAAATVAVRGAAAAAEGEAEAEVEVGSSDLAKTEAANRAAFGFLMGHYSFERYKKSDGGGGGGGEAGGVKAAPAVGEPAAAVAEAAAGDSGTGGKARLVWPEGCDRRHVLSLARAFVWCRDLITTPAEDLGPQHLAAEAAALAAAHPGASFALLQGDQLLREGYPAIHTVGRASHRPPALAVIEWSPRSAAEGAAEGKAEGEAETDAAPLPVVALVGKGVCFDTGGLNVKSAAGMKLMKKDMGGAALMLALASLVMEARLPVRLLVMVPAVENSIAAESYRPLDVLSTRAGITVENGNSDAEGRLILADCLAEAVRRYPSPAGPPDLLLDAATLTGAARTALGPDLPAVFTNDDGTWRRLKAAAAAESDPLWRLPLHGAYRKLLDSKVAQLASVGSAADGQGGAILAALFLAEFAKGAPRWVHIDTGAYNPPSATGPGRPEGGEALALRALWRMLRERYGRQEGRA